MSSNLIYGKHAVNEFIKKHPNLIKKIWFVNIKDLKAENLNCELVNSQHNVLDSLFSEKVNHQNVVAEVKEYNYQPFAEMIENFSKENNKIVLILDQIQDPYNFGAIIRTASLVGVKEIVILDHKQVFVTSTVVKTSAGTVYDVNIAKVSNISNAIKELKKQGFWVYSTNLSSDSQDLRKVDFAQKSAIVIGNEHKGVSELVTKNSDINFYIPSTNTIDSYNANVAASLIMFYVANHIGKI